jgi:hypothetical protein
MTEQFSSVPKTSGIDSEARNMDRNGRWLRQGRNVVLFIDHDDNLTADREFHEVSLSGVPSRKDLIDPRIDFHAQEALHRMFRGDSGARENASGMFAGVKAGDLAGIYIVDQGVPAMRARKMNMGWWQVIPSGEDAILMLDPANPMTGSPLIAFRDKVKSDPSRLDPALRKAWGTHSPWRRGLIRCGLEKSTGQALRNVVPSCSMVPGEPRCGVPPGRVRVQASMARAVSAPRRVVSLQEFENGTPSPQPKLCFFPNISQKDGRELFEKQADRWARRIQALAGPIRGCLLRVGAMPYDTGADILGAIESASLCLDAPVSEIHVFSHSISEGIIGSNPSWIGLYHRDPAIFRNGQVPLDRTRGARIVANIPFAPLAENIVWILHGCNTAASEKNFARSLFEHLAVGLQGPKVFGHHIGVCVGQDGFWREYSRAFPAGKLHKTIPHYGGNGFCGTQRRDN